MGTIGLRFNLKPRKGWRLRGVTDGVGQVGALVGATRRSVRGTEIDGVGGYFFEYPCGSAGAGTKIWSTFSSILVFDMNIFLYFFFLRSGEYLAPPGGRTVSFLALYEERKTSMMNPNASHYSLGGHHLSEPTDE